MPPVVYIYLFGSSQCPFVIVFSNLCRVCNKNNKWRQYRACVVENVHEQVEVRMYYTHPVH